MCFGWLHYYLKGSSVLPHSRMFSKTSILAFEANSALSHQIALFCRFFLWKVISRIFCTFLRILEHTVKMQVHFFPYQTSTRYTLICRKNNPSFVYSYRLRIESMLLKAEFDSNVGYLAPSIEAMLRSGEELMSSHKLQDLFYMVLMAGNFLNSVSIFDFIYLCQNSSIRIYLEHRSLSDLLCF